MTATTAANTRPYHHMPDLIAQIGAAYVRYMDIRSWMPLAELPGSESEEIRSLLDSVDRGLRRTTDFFSYEDRNEETFCREEIATRLQSIHGRMDEAIDLFRNTETYTEDERCWAHYVARATFIPDHA